MAKNTCSLGCDAYVQARGYCSMHYARWRANGHPGPAGRINRKTDPDAVDKQCSTCGEHKPKEAFVREPKSKDGRARQCKPCFAKRAKPARLRRKYALTPEALAAMHTAQAGMCAICGGPPDHRGLVIDHCHATGNVRGLLCNHCNSLLGMARDDVARLRSAIEYLQGAESAIPK